MKILSIVLPIFLFSIYTFGQNQIPTSVFGNGGTLIYSYDYRISSTVGQTLIGNLEGNNFKKQVGFWKPYQILTPVEELKDMIPKEYKLNQNYPNPFNPTTKIKYEIPKSSQVQLVVYDILGREVTTLVNEQKPAGSYEVEFIASQFSSGVYFYELRAGDFRDVKKLVLLK